MSSTALSPATSHRRRAPRAIRRPVVVLLLGLALLGGAALTTWASLAANAPSNQLSFQWSMPERFDGHRDDQGRIAYSDSPEYLHPSSWQVDVDACASPAVQDRGADTKLRWQFTGGPLGTTVKAVTAGCKLRQTLPQLGQYQVTAKLLSDTSVATNGPVTLRDLFIVSVGDSVASGEGNPDLVKPGKLGPLPVFDPVWQEARCDRSALAGPAQAALRLEKRDPHTSVTFLHLACSGATVMKGLLEPYEGQHPIPGAAPKPPQLQQAVDLAGGRAIDTLTMSIGANDMGFADIVKACMLLTNCDTAKVPGVDNGTDIYTKGLAKLPGLYSAVDKKLDGFVDAQNKPLVKNVLLTEYFDLSQDDTGGYCNAPGVEGYPGTTDGFTASEMQWTHEVVGPKLNAAVKAGADAANAANQGPAGSTGPQWTFVTGIASAFDTHGYCAKDRYVRTLLESFAYQHQYDGAFHPNSEGHLFGYAKAIEAAAAPVNGIGGTPVPFEVDPGVTQTAAGLTKFVEFLDHANAIDTIKAQIPFGGAQLADKGWQYVFEGLHTLQQKALALSKTYGDTLYQFDADLDDLDGDGDPTSDFHGIDGLTIDFDVDIEPKVPSSHYDLTFQFKASVEQGSKFAWVADGLDFVSRGNSAEQGVLFDVEQKFRWNVLDANLQVPADGKPFATLGVNVNAAFDADAPGKTATNPLSFKAGLLGVTAVGTVNADLGVAIGFNTEYDVNGDDVLDASEIQAASLDDLFSLACTSKGATVALQGTAAFAGLEQEIGRIGLTDANLCDGLAAPTVTLGQIGDFRNLTLADLVNGLAQVTNALRTAQQNGDLDLPLLEAPLSKAADISARLTKFFVDNGYTDPANPMATITVDPATNTNVQDLTQFATKLWCALSPPATGQPCPVEQALTELKMRYEAGFLRFSVKKDIAVGSVPVGLEIGDGFANTGLTGVTGTTKATVTPSFSLGFGFGFDLRSSSPLPDRVYLSNGANDALFSADVPVTAEVNLQAALGVVGVKLRDTVDGPVTLLQRSGTAPMLTVRLDRPAGDTRGLSLAQLTGGAKPPITAAIGATVPKTVLRATMDVLGQQIGAGSIELSWPNVADVNGFRVTADGRFGEVALPFAYDPNNPRAVVGQVLTAVRTTLTKLRASIAAGEITTTTKLPFVGKSVADLDPVLAKVERAVDTLISTNDALTLPALQQAVDKALADALGAPGKTGLVTLGFTAPPAGGQGAVTVSLKLGACTTDRVVAGCTATPAPLDTPFVFDLGPNSSSGGIAEAIGAGGNGSAKVSYDAKAELSFGVLLPKVSVGPKPSDRPVIDTATPWGLFVADTTGFDVGIKASVDAVLAATFGPVKVALGNGDQRATAAVAARFVMRKANPTGARYLVSTPAFDSFLAGLVPARTVDLTETRGGYGVSCNQAAVDGCASLPVFVNGTSLGTVAVTLVDLLDPATWNVDAQQVIDRLSDESVQFSIVVGGVRQLAAQLQASLRNLPAGTRVPLLGTDPLAGADLVAQFDQKVLGPLDTLAGRLQQVSKPLELKRTAEAFLSDRANFPALASGATATVTVLCKATGGGTRPCVDADTIGALQSFEVTRLPIGLGMSATTPGLDLGFPGLRLTSTQGVTGSITAVVDVAFGIDRSLGFYVPVGTRQSPGTPEVSLQAALALPSTMKGQLAFLPIGITDQHAGNDVTASVGVNLTTPRADGRMPLQELGSVEISPSLSVTSNVELRFATEMPAGMPSSIPKLGATLAVTGGVNWDGTGTPRPNFGVAFTNVTLDAGSAVSELLLPAARELRKYTSPLEPAVEAIRKPIPGAQQAAELTGLTAPTWYDLFEKVSNASGGSSSFAMVKNLVTLVEAVKALDQAGTANGLIDLGSFSLDTGLAANPVAPADADKLVKSPSTRGDVLSRLSFTGKGDLDKVTRTGSLTFPAFSQPTLLFQLLLGKDVPLVYYDAGTLDVGASIQLAFPVGPMMLYIGGSASIEGHFAAGFDTYGIRKALEVLTDGDDSNNGWFDVTQGLLMGFYLDDFNSKGEDVPEIRFTAELTVGASLGFFGLSAGAEGGVRGQVDFDLYTEPAQNGKIRYTDIIRQIKANPNPLCFFDASAKVSAFVRAYVKSPFGKATYNIADVVLWKQDNLLAFCRSNLPNGPGQPPGTNLPVLGTVKSGTLTLKTSDTADVIGVQVTNGTTGAVVVSKAGKTQAFVGVTKVFADLKGGDDELTVGGAEASDLVVTACGGAGSDRLVTSTGRAEFWGDGGGPGCASVSDDASGVDRLEGGPGDDLLVGGAKGDFLVGNGGGDDLQGGAGDDSLRGGAGDDTIAGGEDSDVNDYSDHISSVTVDGDSWGSDDENDEVTGVEQVIGSRADDHLSLPSGIVDGGAGDDTLTAGDGPVLLLGGTGSDTFLGGTGSAIMVGGDGDDRFVDGPGPQQVDGGAGRDTVDYSALATSVRVTVDGAANDGPANVAPDNIVGAEVLLGGSGDDTLSATGPGVELHGNGGNDTLLGGGGSTLFGGAGDDTMSAGPGADTFVGGEGKDTVTYADRATPVYVTIGNGANDGAFNGLTDYYTSPEKDDVQADVERVIGGSGDDWIFGNNGANELFGGPGDDHVVGDWWTNGNGPVRDGGADLVDGGPGNDYVCDFWFNSCNSGSQVGYNGDTSHDVLIGGDGADIVVSDGGGDTLDGGAGADILRGGGNDPARSGGKGWDDTVRGGDGDDNIATYDGNDTIDGGAGSDVIDGGSGDDTIRGGTSTDSRGSIVGGLGNDTIWAESAGGTIDAGLRRPNRQEDFGPNTVFGGPGPDTVYGGGGRDVITTYDGDDHVFGGSGPDVIDLGAGNDEGRGDVGAGSLAEDCVVPGSCDDTITGGTGNEILLSGDWGDDVLVGGDGDDVLKGGPGNDNLSGGADDDVLWGDAGSDVLDGGTGADQLRGFNDGSEFNNAAERSEVDTVTWADRTEPITITSQIGTGNGGASDKTTSTAWNARKDDDLGGDFERYLLGSGNDVVDLGRYNGQVAPVTVDLGAGDDTVRVWPNLLQPVKVLGGRGDDTLDEGTARNGATEFQGGLGTDTVTYRRTDGTAYWTTDNKANDGAAGEGDNIRSDVENVVGATAGTPPPPPAPTVSVAPVTVSEGVAGGLVTVTVTLSRPSATAVSVRWATVAGTAVSGGARPDFVRASGVVKFAPGVTTATFTVALVNDTVKEPSETFTVVLSGPSGAVLTSTPSGVVTIQDDD